MKKTMILMHVFIGFLMSLVLSLVGTLRGGHFTLPSWIVAFLISFLIALIISFMIPVKKLADSFCDKLKVDILSFKGILAGSVIFDLIFTPVISFIMVSTMRRFAAMHAPEGSLPPFGVIIVPQILSSMIIGYVVIVIAQIIFNKCIDKKDK